MKLSVSEPDVQTIVKRINEGDIDLQPEFQRQEVWSVTKKKRLIDTILRGWSIPPIHLVETSDSRLEVLDGQQRLASLRDFIDNRFSIDGRITPTDDRVVMLHGKFYRQLDINVRRSIDQYGIRCFRITDYQPEEPSELFYRLNQPTMLTAGEQRNALFGPARQQLKELVSYFERQGNDKSSLGFSNIRLAYDDVIARLLYFFEAQSFGLKSSEARISERFRSQDAFGDEVVGKIHRAIDLFSDGHRLIFAYRFNKASVLSWLIFYSRFAKDEPPATDFMDLLYRVQISEIRAQNVQAAVAVFNDRSSLRVTDVSSVVYRDFCLCYSYYFLTKDKLPTTVDTNKIKEVDDYYSSLQDETFESALGKLVDIDRWSSSL